MTGKTLSAAYALVLCCCLAFSCSKSGAPPSVSVHVRAQIHPTHVMVIVRDVEGFFADCGCASSATGGLARVARVAPASTHAATLVLAGNFLVSRSNESAWKALDLHWPQLRMVLSQLGPTVIAGNATDVEFLSSRGALPTNVSVAEPGQRLPWVDGLFYSIGRDGRVVVEENNRVVVSRDVSSLGTRGRQAMVLGIWNSSIVQAATYSERLGPAYLKWTLAGLDKDELDVRSLLEQTSTPVLGSYTRELGLLVGEHGTLAELIADLELRLSHSTPGDGPHPKHESQAPDCARCHQDAYAVWSGTRHARAMQTLSSKGKHADSRCLPCHSSVPGTQHPIPVSCLSCHREPGRPTSLETCRGCHTSVTDPDARYLSGLNSICIKNSGSHSICPRR